MSQSENVLSSRSVCSGGVVCGDTYSTQDLRLHCHLRWHRFLPREKPMKTRTHNEWFQPTSYAKCDCGSNVRQRTTAGHDVTVYVWGEYVVGKWRTVQRVCQSCFAQQVIPRLVQHAGGCGCEFALQPRSGYRLAPWITLAETSLCHIQERGAA